MARPVVHWEIGGRDLDTLADFYRALFGWEPASFDPDYRLVDLDEGIGGRPLLPPTPIPGVGAFALFQDPEGNTIGILHPSPSA